MAGLDQVKPGHDDGGNAIGQKIAIGAAAGILIFIFSASPLQEFRTLAISAIAGWKALNAPDGKQPHPPHAAN
jgi:hypothetical protein